MPGSIRPDGKPDANWSRTRRGPAAIFVLNGKPAGKLYLCFWIAKAPQLRGARAWQEGQAGLRPGLAG